MSEIYHWFDLTSGQSPQCILECGIFLSMLKNHPSIRRGERSVAPSCHSSKMGGF